MHALNAGCTIPPHPTFVNSSSPGQNGRQVVDDNLRCIFENENFYILIEMKFVSKGRIDNNSTLVYIMEWRRIGDKPLSEQMLTRFTDAYICGNRRRWVEETTMTYHIM